jgi:hypothetical protein
MNESRVSWKTEWTRSRSAPRMKRWRRRDLLTISSGFAIAKMCAMIQMVYPLAFNKRKTFLCPFAWLDWDRAICR